MLSLTTKHAIKTLISVPKSTNSSYMRVCDLAKETRVPSPYLSKIAKRLVKAGLLNGRKGPGGGISITDKGQNATLFDVCVSMGDPIIETGCFLSRKECNSKSPCPMHSIWSQFKNEIIKFLTGTKISSLK